jgi:hypothetical protein
VRVTWYALSSDDCDVVIHDLHPGTAKDRKIICHSLKDMILRVSSDEFGHRVLLSLLAFTDDTLLTKKSILDEVPPPLLLRSLPLSLLPFLSLLLDYFPSLFSPSVIDCLVRS